VCTIAIQASSNYGVKNYTSAQRQANFTLPSFIKAEEMLIKTDVNYHPLPLAQFIVPLRRYVFAVSHYLKYWYQ
jgi:hypothetical protein